MATTRLNVLEPLGASDIISELGAEPHSEREAEDCVEACAICLCWHLASLPQSRRVALMQKLMFATPEHISPRVAAFVKVVECPREVHENAQAETRQRRKLPPLIMPYWTRKHCRELVRRLIRMMGVDLRPGEILEVSDVEIGLRACECYAAMCHFLGQLNGAKRQNLAVGWWLYAPSFVDLAIAVGVAEEKTIPVKDALNSLAHPTVELEYNELPFVTWQNADGGIRISGSVKLPLEEIANEFCFEHAVGEAVGTNLSFVPMEVLNEILSRHHSELAQLADDDERHWTISQAEYEAGVRRCLNKTDRRELMRFHTAKAVTEEAMGEDKTVH